MECTEYSLFLIGCFRSIAFYRLWLWMLSSSPYLVKVWYLFFRLLGFSSFICYSHTRCSPGFPPEVLLRFYWRLGIGSFFSVFGWFQYSFVLWHNWYWGSGVKYYFFRYAIDFHCRGIVFICFFDFLDFFDVMYAFVWLTWWFVRFVHFISSSVSLFTVRLLLNFCLHAVA